MPYCENCGTHISDQAASCPNCGHPAVAPGAGIIEVPYADVGKRFIALLIDGAIVFVAGYGLRRGLGGSFLGFLYNWLLIAFNDGRTIGKMAMRIRVARPDGSSVDLGTAAARAGMAIVSGLALGIGYLWAAFDSERRTWHDMVANTRVFDVSAIS